MNSPIKKPLAKGLVKQEQFNFRVKVKQVIVRLACYGLIPMALADWLLRVGGLAHE
jgi:hypothetical protein